MDHSNPLGITVNADTGKNGCRTGTDILAHDDRDRHAVGDAAGHGKGLQHT